MRAKKVLKTIGLSILAIIGAAVLAALVLVLLFISKYGKKWQSLKDSAVSIATASVREDFCSAATSTVYAADGSVICTLKAEKDVYYLDYEDIPDSVIYTFLAMEDRNFYRHKGIDYKAIVRAAWSLYTKKEITQGGSTITQQISRNTYLSHDVTWERKIEEMFLAMALEKKYSKQDILEFYVNGVYFANGNYGIQAAAKGYFSKDVSELTLSEIVFLCCIPNNPGMYDPLTNMDAVMSRRDMVLETLYELGTIDREEYREAILKDIKLNPEVSKRSNYVETYVFECATAALIKEQGLDYQEALMKLYTGGFSIYTSIEPKLQNRLKISLDGELAGYTEVNSEGVYTLQGAGVCIDNDTGNVVAIVGGRSQEIKGYTLNRAFQSYRQPGSAIKPLVTYTPLLSEEYGYTADTIVLDKKKDGGPANSNNRYAGEITLRKAVTASKNTVAWELFEKLGADKALQYLKDMNFEKIVDSDYVPAASLGGLTYGTTALEMAAAYATIENDGVYREPTCVVKITDARGNVIVESNQEEKRVYTTKASRAMTDILESVVKEGTGKQARLDNMTCAGKTGTTDDNRDGWFVGYTPYYTTAVWVGYDMPKSMDDLYGYTYPGRIWKAYMESIHEGLCDKAFATVEEYLEEVKFGSLDEAGDKSDKADGKKPLTDAGIDWEDNTKNPYEIN